LIFTRVKLVRIIGTKTVGGRVERHVPTIGRDIQT
jgi:hypothetical protein